MPPSVTSKDVLAAVERLGVTLNAGQNELGRRMTAVEAEMQRVGTCVAVNTTAIAVLKEQTSDHDDRLGLVETREREGAIKQAGITVTLATLIPLVISWAKEQLHMP